MEEVCRTPDGGSHRTLCQTKEKWTRFPQPSPIDDLVIHRIRTMIATESTLQWTEAEPPATISTRQELDQALHKVEARCNPEHPIIVALSVHGYEVGIGLGLPESFVNVKSWERGTPESGLITVGDGRAKRGAVFFFLDKQRTEIAQRNLIPMALARQIVREFFETGRRSTSVPWEKL